MSIKSNLAVAGATLAPVLAFAAEDATVTALKAQVTDSLSQGQSIVVAAGTALVTLAFVMFIIRKARNGAGGKAK